MKKITEVVHQEGGNKMPQQQCAKGEMQQMTWVGMTLTVFCKWPHEAKGAGGGKARRMNGGLQCKMLR